MFHLYTFANETFSTNKFGVTPKLHFSKTQGDNF